jgi:hypothetical protein
MNAEAPITQKHDEGKESIGSRPWFATFTFLDAGCAINSSQAQRLVASIAKLWRRTIGRLV